MKKEGSGWSAYLRPVLYVACCVIIMFIIIALLFQGPKEELEIVSAHPQESRKHLNHLIMHKLAQHNMPPPANAFSLKGYNDMKTMIIDSGKLTLACNIPGNEVLIKISGRNVTYYSDNKAKHRMIWSNLLATKAVVVQHPIHRFLNTYAKECSKTADQKQQKQCFGCPGNLTCFVDALNDRLHNIVHHPEKAPRGDNSVEAKFYPQFWCCDFRYHLRSYTAVDTSRINKTAALQASSNLVFSGAIEVGENTRMVNRFISQLRQDPDRLNELYLMYYIDFVHFRYDTELAAEVCKEHKTSNLLMCTEEFGAYREMYSQLSMGQFDKFN